MDDIFIFQNSFTNTALNFESCWASCIFIYISILQFEQRFGVYEGKPSRELMEAAKQNSHRSWTEFSPPGGETMKEVLAIKLCISSNYASLQKEIILISQGCVYFIEFLCKGRRNYLLFWIVLFTMYHGRWGIQFKFDIGIYVYVKTRLCMTYF